MNTRCILLCAVLLLATSSASSAPGSERGAETGIAERTDEIIEHFVSTAGFSGSALISIDGKRVYERSVGLADIENDIPNTASTRIRIGSINKHFTAALVLRKVEAGELGLEDKLAKFDLGFPADVAERITIRHLLNHTSGFGDLFTQEYLDAYRSLRTVSDKLALLVDSPLISAPGEERHYSNYGYIVLGAILETIEGRPFKAILEREILDRIGADDTVYDFTENVENKALSYRFNDDGTKTDRTPILENVTPDGGMYSTPRDLAHFYTQLLFEDTIIDDRSKATWFSGFRTPDRRWSDLVADSDIHWTSYGGGPGVSAAVEILVADRLIVVILANTDGLVAERISQRIVEAYRDPGPRAAVPPNPK